MLKDKVQTQGHSIINRSVGTVGKLKGVKERVSSSFPEFQTKEEMNILMSCDNNIQKQMLYFFFIIINVTTSRDNKPRIQMLDILCTYLTYQESASSEECLDWNLGGN